MIHGRNYLTAFGPRRAPVDSVDLDAQVGCPEAKSEAIQFRAFQGLASESQNLTLLVHCYKRVAETHIAVLAVWGMR